MRKCVSEDILYIYLFKNKCVSDGGFSVDENFRLLQRIKVGPSGRKRNSLSLCWLESLLWCPDLCTRNAINSNFWFAGIQS